MKDPYHFTTMEALAKLAWALGVSPDSSNKNPSYKTDNMLGAIS